MCFPFHIRDESFNLFNNANLYVTPNIGIAVRVFANGPGDLGSIPGRVIPKQMY